MKCLITSKGTVSFCQLHFKRKKKYCLYIKRILYNMDTSIVFFFSGLHGKFKTSNLAPVLHQFARTKTTKAWMYFSSTIERVGWCWIWYWLISKKAPSLSSSHWRHKHILAKYFKRTGGRTITLRIAGFLLAYPLFWGMSCMQIAVCADLISSDDTQAKLFRLTLQICATLSPNQEYTLSILLSHLVNHTCQQWALKIREILHYAKRFHSQL